MKRIINKIHTIKRRMETKLGRDCISVTYNFHKQDLRIRCPKSFEDRTVKSLEMFMMAFEYAKPQIKKDFKFLICCEDFPEGIHSRARILSYTKDESKGNTQIVMIPDFCFLNWKESGMLDYDECCNSLLEASRLQPLHDTLFWIGNTKTHPTRKTLCQIGEEDSRIEAYGMDWVYKDGRARPTQFVSLKDHTQYKYLIDVQGRGYSGRTKVLMFSGRPLFIADRKWKEFWYNDLVPFEHYIPVKEDLSDLVEKLNWAEENPDQANAIAHNAQEFAKNKLTRKAALKYYADLIVRLVNEES